MIGLNFGFLYKNLIQPPQLSWKEKLRILDNYERRRRTRRGKEIREGRKRLKLAYLTSSSVAPSGTGLWYLHYMVSREKRGWREGRALFFNRRKGGFKKKVKPLFETNTNFHWTDWLTALNSCIHLSTHINTQKLSSKTFPSPGFSCYSAKKLKISATSRLLP